MASDEAAIGAIIVAAGQSRRMDGSEKLWASLASSDGRRRPLLAHTLIAFQRCPTIAQVVVVAAEASVERAEQLLRDEASAARGAVVVGGGRRQDSVRAGLEALDGCSWVVVHDGARPLVTPQLIERGLAEAQETGASCCAIRVADTVKEGDGAGRIVRTLDRSRLWLAQTPQTFRYDLLLEAHRRAKEKATDDAALVEALGVKVRLFEGSRRNIKVTTPEDLALAEALLQTTE